MSQTLLISGPPGYGKTSWILNRIQSHPGPCGFLPLAGYPDQALAPRPAKLLALIELPQFQPPEGLTACNCSYPSQLEERRGHLAHQWTADQLSEENKAFLASLPMALRRDRLLFVHGRPNSQHEYLLPDMDAFAALERVESAGADTLFCGHTHRPYVRELREGSIRLRVRQRPGEPAGVHEWEERGLRLPLRRINNAGSLGEPRHGHTHATNVIHDADTGAVEIREVPYDVKRTCTASVEAGLPPIFAWRLRHGFEYAERADDASHVCEH